MTRLIEANPVTRIEGHAKVSIEIDDAGNVVDATLQVLEFRGFEKFVQGMQVELMPTLTTRICGTCPHAHHLAAAKALDRVFSVDPPRSAVLLRGLLNCGSMIHSHAIHFFALAGPDLFVPPGAPASERNVLSLLRAEPELVQNALRLRSVGQRIAELVGGRGTHPVTCVAGGMAAGIDVEAREHARRLAAEAVTLAQFALRAGGSVLERRPEALITLPIACHDMGTVRDGALELYDGTLRVCRSDGSVAKEFSAEEYGDVMVERALPRSYAKQVAFRDPAQGLVAYRVGPLARLNVVDRIETPMAADALGRFRERWGKPCADVVAGHFARLVELLHHAEKAAALLEDDAILDPSVRTPITATPRRGIAHVEAPRGVLIHDYDVEENGLVRSANFVVATQHNLWAINSSIRCAAEGVLDGDDEQVLSAVEFAIRCHDPCLSCSTHQVGAMPLDVTVARGGQILRRVRR
ncbi:MAG: Ni/Fe hydrogenase subunit alpha [Polyangiaceae bacterium]|nr:Ni/Fe hydrogenase subunit alpha [Polyangiaceae bacterium]